MVLDYLAKTPNKHDSYEAICNKISKNTIMQLHNRDSTCYIQAE